jgi:hypothetical protein
VDELVSWASDIKEYALQQALSGKEWHGFKLVEGRSIRKYTDETVRRQGGRRRRIRPVSRGSCSASPPCRSSSASPVSMNSCQAYIEKPQGKPTLVPDSRQAPGHEHSKKRFYGGKRL